MYACFLQVQGNIDFSRAIGHFLVGRGTAAASVVENRRYGLAQGAHILFEAPMRD